MTLLGGWAGPAGKAGAVLVCAALVAVAQPLYDLLHSRLREDANSPTLQPLQFIKGCQDAARQSILVSRILHTMRSPYPRMSNTEGFSGMVKLFYCNHLAQQLWPRCCTGWTASADLAVVSHDTMLGTRCKCLAQRRDYVAYRWASVMQGALRGSLQAGHGLHLT